MARGSAAGRGLVLLGGVELLIGIALAASPVKDQSGAICGRALGLLTHGDSWAHGGERDAATIAATDTACTHAAIRQLAAAAGSGLVGTLTLAVFLWLRQPAVTSGFSPRVPPRA